MAQSFIVIIHFYKFRQGSRGVPVKAFLGQVLPEVFTVDEFELLVVGLVVVLVFGGYAARVISK